MIRTVFSLTLEHDAEDVVATLTSAVAGLGADYAGGVLYVTAGAGDAAVADRARKFFDGTGKLGWVEIEGPATPPIATRAAEFARGVDAPAVLNLDD